MIRSVLGVPDFFANEKLGTKRTRQGGNRLGSKGRKLLKEGGKKGGAN